jgi:hypothetical protein
MNDSIDVLTDWEKIEGVTSWRPHFGYCFGDHVRQAKVWAIIGSYSMACHDLRNYACKPSDYLADLKADHGGELPAQKFLVFVWRRLDQVPHQRPHLLGLH